MEMRTKFKIVLKAVIMTIAIILAWLVVNLFIVFAVDYMLTDIGRFVSLWMVIIGIIVYIFVKSYKHIHDKMAEEEEDN